MTFGIKGKRKRNHNSSLQDPSHGNPKLLQDSRSGDPGSVHKKSPVKKSRTGFINFTAAKVKQQDELTAKHVRYSNMEQRREGTTRIITAFN